MDTKIISKNKKINLKHQSETPDGCKDPQLSVIAWSIPTMLTQFSLAEKHPVMLPEDFKAYSSIQVKNHFSSCGNLPRKFKVKCFFPEVFRNLREKFSFDEELYRKCFKLEFLNYLPQKYNKKFFVSSDKSMVIKVISNDQFEVFQSYIQTYHKHIIENRGETILTHYIGLYMVKIDSKKTYYLAMLNIFSKNNHCKLKFLVKSKLIGKKPKLNSKTERFIKDVNIIKDLLEIKLAGDSSLLITRIESALEFFYENNIDEFRLCIGWYKPNFVPDSKLLKEYIMDSDGEVSSDAITDEEEEESVENSKVKESFIKNFQFNGRDGQVYFIGFEDIFKNAAVLKKGQYRNSTEISSNSQKIENIAFRDYVNNLIKIYSSSI